MPSVPVFTVRPAGSARLLAWGRDTDGHWFGLVALRTRVRRADSEAVEDIDCAAWLAADRIRPNSRSGASTDELPRIDLSSGFPPPPGWERHFLGVWTDGALPLPDGLTAVTGPAWRK